jgi:hypothetical protein
VTTRTGKLLVADKLFIDWMAGLFVELEADIPVARKTKVRFLGQ